MHRARLPIADPCHERFDAMEGDGAQRFCASCRTHVHDLSQMTEREAAAFLARRSGEKVCVRYRADAAGRLRFAAAPPARTALATVALGLALAACTGHLEADTVDSPESALLCEDPAGYTIPCVDVVEERNPERGAPPDAEPDPVPEDDVVQGGLMPTIEGVPIPEIEVVSMGTVALVEPAVEPGEGCPLPSPEADQVDGDVQVLMGSTALPLTARQERRLARQARREERRRQRDR